MEEVYKRVNYTNENFRKNIEFLISKRNLTKNTLEKKLEMGEGALSRYCKLGKGAPEPKIGILNTLAKAFGVTIDDLINSDLQEKEQEVLESNQRKEVLFCKKLIENTNKNLCDWRNLDFYNDGFIESEVWGEDVLSSNWIELDGKFKSKFTNISYECDTLNAFTFMLSKEVQVVIIECLNLECEESLSNVSHSYELYLIKSNGRVLPSCSSHRYSDDVLYEVLKDLYRRAYDYFRFGKDNYEKESIYDDYLNEVYLNELEIPF